MGYERILYKSKSLRLKYVRIMNDEMNMIEKLNQKGNFS